MLHLENLLDLYAKLQQLSVHKCLAGTKSQTSIYAISTIIVGESKHTEDKECHQETQFIPCNFKDITENRKLDLRRSTHFHRQYFCNSPICQRLTQPLSEETRTFFPSLFCASLKLGSKNILCFAAAFHKKFKSCTSPVHPQQGIKL